MAASPARTWDFASRDMLSNLFICLLSTLLEQPPHGALEHSMKNRKVLLVFLLMVGVAVSIAAASSDSTDTRLEEFIPTEKVPADHAISFPVDI